MSTLVVSEDRVYACMQAAAWRKRASIVARMILGMLLLLIGPAAVASIGWVVMAVGLHHITPWTWCFAAMIVIMVPLLLRLEARTKGNYLADAVRDSAPDSAGWMRGPSLLMPMAGLTSTLRNPRGVSAGFMEIFLMGPRLLLRAYREARTLRVLAHVDRHLAANVLLKLVEREHGLPPKDLFPPLEVPNATPTLAWLALQGWIGVAAGGERAYLYSEARRKLQRALR
jgi:hypothetical protein